MPSTHTRREFFRSLSIRSRCILLAAIFSIFASIIILPAFAGFYPLRPWWVTLVMGVYGGAVAIGYAMSAMWSPRILFFNIPFSFVFPFGFFLWLYNLSGLAATRPTFIVDAGVLAIAAMLLIILGYTLFIVFMQGEAAQKIRLSAEMALAQRIHAALVPTLHTRNPHLEIYAVSSPSTEMGGDLVDVLQHDDHTDCILADVSGHGVRAGVVMGMIKSSLRTRALAPSPLDELLSDLNRVLTDLTEPDVFATLAAIRFQRADPSHARYTLAGHLPILHHRAADNSLAELEAESLPIAIDADERFPLRSATCAPGDTLLLYTDGLTEAATRAGELFGAPRLRNAFISNVALPLPALAEALLAAPRAHAPQTDDQSLMLIRIL